MDYALLPQQRTREHIEIPCVATEEYDDGDFLEYPTRQGWHERRVDEWITLFNNPPPRLVSFLQTWLFFGPIAVTFRIHVALASFTKRGKNGDLVIDTSMLEELFRREPIFIHNESRSRIFGRMFGLFGTLHNGLRMPHTVVIEKDKRMSLVGFMTVGRPDDPRSQPTITATTLLFELLCEYYYCSGRLRAGAQPITLMGARNLSMMDYSPLYREMREDGWCPSELCVFFRRSNTSAIYYMRSVERPHPERQHNAIRIRQPRSLKPDSQPYTTLPEKNGAVMTKNLCSRERCGFLQLSDQAYETKHADGCDPSTCFDMVADRNEVLEILQSGSIPLIMAIDEDTNDPNLLLVPSGPDFSCSYVAISHVWSDGLGNVHRSALPRCQIRRLSKMVQSLPGKSSDILLFWVDTIGCPPDEAGDNEAQELAISMMRQTYQNASAVLVLDSWLLTKTMKFVPEYETLMSIVASAWNGRLWTLQEGALAKMLYFQFADGPYDVDEGIQSIHDSYDPILKLTLAPKIVERLHEIRGYLDQNLNAPWQKLEALRGALSTRSTSVATDEALCLGVLLNFDKAKFIKIVEAKPEDRMKTFWSLFTHVPRTIVFDHYERLNVPGYRWAPRSFLNSHFNVFGDFRSVMGESGGEELARATPGGLVLQTAGLVFPNGECPIGSVLHLVDAQGFVYRVGYSVDELGDNVENVDVSAFFDPSDLQNPELYEGSRPCEPTVDFYKSYGADTICLVLQGDPRTNTSKGGIGGIWCSMELDHEGVIRARRLCGASCDILQANVDGAMIKSVNDAFAMPIRDDDPLRDHPRSNKIFLQNGVMRIAGCSVYGKNQTWCID